jgi:DNA-directed RNA polymerase specialized sigma24 family protein
MESTRHFREDQLAREATEWVSRRLQDSSVETREAFAEWITRSADHLHQFLLATAVLEELSRTQGYAALGGIAVAADALSFDSAASGDRALPASPDYGDSRDVDIELIARAVGRLPAHCRRVFTLRKVYGWSQQEIANRLELANEVVEQQLCQATCHLIRILPELTH